jgi:hypothetical protein
VWSKVNSLVIMQTSDGFTKGLADAPRQFLRYGGVESFEFAVAASVAGSCGLSASEV